MQRKNFTLDPFGIHWFELDEDLSSEVFFCTSPHHAVILFDVPRLNIKRKSPEWGISICLKSFINQSDYT